MRIPSVIGVIASVGVIAPCAQAQEFALLEHHYEQPETAGNQDLWTSDEAQSRVLLPATYREALGLTSAKRTWSRRTPAISRYSLACPSSRKPFVSKTLRERRFDAR